MQTNKAQKLQAAGFRSQGDLFIRPVRDQHTMPGWQLVVSIDANRITLEDAHGREKQSHAIDWDQIQ